MGEHVTQAQACDVTDPSRSLTQLILALQRRKEWQGSADKQCVSMGPLCKATVTLPPVFCFKKNP